MRAILLYLLISFNVIAKELPLTVLVTHFPPFINQEIPSQGLSWNLLHDFAASKGIAIQPEYLPTARLMTQVESGNWQATITPIPEETMGLVKVNYAKNIVRYGLLVKEENPFNLAELHIAAIRTAGFSAVQKHLLEQGVKISEVNNLEQGYLMYEAGRVDAVLGIIMDGKAIGATDDEEFVMALKLAEFTFTLSLNNKNLIASNAYDKLTSP